MRRSLRGFALAACMACTVTPVANRVNVANSTPPRPAFVSSDPFDSTLTVNGSVRWAVVEGYPERRSTQLNLRPPGYFLQTRINKHSGAASHVLAVQHTYSGEWVFWERANLDDQRPLTFIQSEREVLSCSAYLGCSHKEVFGAVIPDSIMAARRSGLRVKFYSSSGPTAIASVDSALLGEQRRVVDSVRTTLVRSKDTPR
jgi:hypothetical protein